jgi:hypothetical protein
MTIHNLKSNAAHSMMDGIAIIVKLIICFITGAESALLLYRILAE